LGQGKGVVAGDHFAVTLFLADFRQPPLERLGLRAGDGLDQAKKTFGVPAQNILLPTGSSEGQSKGGEQIVHPL